MSDLYDSTQDTLEHIARVEGYMSLFADLLRLRAARHDASKLESPEKEIFDAVTPKLKTLTYGSDEYKSALVDMGDALKHHYANNSHHPEHWRNGINGMSLLDLMEMLCDWVAASKRHADGDVWKSMEINRERFQCSDQLYEILCNTIAEIGW
jgi:hypothetical protein